MRKFLGEVNLAYRQNQHRIGPAPDEVILHYVLASGSYEGANLHLTVVPDSGGEWDMTRGDGVMTLESKHVLRTPSGELVFANLLGLYDLGEDGYADALDDILTSKVSAELVLRFQTGAKQYRWLNRGVFFGRGERDFAGRTLQLQIFSVS